MSLLPDASPLDPNRYATLRRLVSDDHNRLVVSLGGGSLAGLCGNVALIHILDELGMRSRVREIWGTSAGAVVGAGWACGTTPAGVYELMLGLGRGKALDFDMFRFALSILASLWPFRRPLPEGLIRGCRFRETIQRGLQVETFEECEIPFRCIACTSDGMAQRKVFRRGQLLPAIFSSMSLPGIVVPNPIPEDGKAYYDGGLVEKTPLVSPIADHLKSGDKRKLLLIATHFGNESQGEAHGFHNRFLSTMYALENLAWDYQLKEARDRQGVNVMVLNPRLAETAMFDFSRVEVNYKKARERFARQLENAYIAETFGTV